MNDLNVFSATGRLTRDAEMFYTTSGTAVCKFSLAVNKSYTDKGTGEKRESAAFLDCQIWGKGAEPVSKYLLKGKRVAVTGSVNQESWSDKTTGAKRSKISFNIDQTVFLDPSPNAKNGTVEAQNYSGGYADPWATPGAPQNEDSGSDSEIPF
jgi:single-strand DNA-binding protein